MVIAVDFDGTCVSHEFPRIGNDIGSVPVLKRLIDAGHQLVLFTMRSDIEHPMASNDRIHGSGGKYLTDAVNWFKAKQIPLFGVQVNPEQLLWTKSPKAYAELYIDDVALGIPLKHDLRVSGRPFVDWEQVEFLLEREGILPNKEAVII